MAWGCAIAGPYPSWPCRTANCQLCLSVLYGTMQVHYVATDVDEEETFWCAGDDLKSMIHMAVKRNRKEQHGRRKIGCDGIKFTPFSRRHLWTRRGNRFVCHQTNIQSNILDVDVDETCRIDICNCSEEMNARICIGEQCIAPPWTRAIESTPEYD